MRGLAACACILSSCLRFGLQIWLIIYAMERSHVPSTRGVNARRSAPTTEAHMIRKLKTGEYRLYSQKVDPKTGKRRNLGTFKSLEAAKKHERAVQYFKRRG